MPNNQEQSTPNQNNSAETHQTATKHIEKLSENDNTVELSPRDIETRTEEARIEALKSISTNRKGKNAEKTLNKKNNYRRGTINNKQRAESYAKTLKQVQNELPLSSRLFSKIIHTQVIERTSDLLGNTVARPDAMLSGAFFAFILTLLTYITAKTIGYALSGFETIAAFILGWIIGIIYDYLHVLFTGKKN